MTYYGGAKLAEAFRTVRKNTLVIAEEIGEENYGFSPAGGARTVAQLLTHIAMGTRMPEQIHKIEHVSDLAQFNFFAVLGALGAEEANPRTKAEIVALLKESGENFAGWLEGLSEEFLAEVVQYPPHMTPATKTRFEMIMSAKEHEMHHRGQLMVVQRLLGTVPPLTRAMQAQIAAMQAQAASK